ncbi:Ig-like domain-containing protein, partial [Anaerosporobacter sp.]
MKEKNKLLTILKTMSLSIFVLVMISNVSNVLAAEILTYAGSSKDTATLLQYNDTGYYSTKLNDESDWYMFQTPNTPGYTNVYFKNTGMSSRAGFYIYSVVDETLKNNNYVYRNDYVNYSLKLENNQTYYIEITKGTQGSTYVLDLDFTPDVVGNTKNDATTINCNTEYNWSMDGYKDEDYAVFTATKTGKHQISFKNTGVDASLDVAVYDYNTDELLCNDWYVYQNRTFTSVLDLEQGQKYYIYIGDNYSALGNYIFSINNQSVEKITINKSVLKIIDDRTTKLTATIYPTNAYNTDVTWASNNSDIAYVDSNGNVTARKPGSTIITCTANDGSGVISNCTVIVTPSKITYLNRDTSKTSNSSFYVSWNQLNSVSGYTIYCYDTKTKKYSAVKTVNSDTTKTTIKKIKIGGKSKSLTPGKTYKIKVAAYITVDGKKYYGPKSDSFSYATSPSKPKLTSVKYSNGEFGLNWSKVSGATGYVIYV